MDKSDVFGALLPVVESVDADSQELLEAISQTESFDAVLRLVQSHYQLDVLSAREKLAEFVQQIEAKSETTPIHYKYYPSEIVRAMEKGYLLEIQEPTVIRDASVLVALNSALEPNGMLNLPAGIVRRHPDCVVVITTNRNYQGNRPLNESLRDRMQHAEKMDLPSLEVMVERAVGKTGIQDSAILFKMAEIIRLLDETAKANAIKGVAGMRSYFYWVNTMKQGQDLLQSIYPKVLYKLTTDPDELKILLQALEDTGLLIELRELLRAKKWGEATDAPTVRGRKISGLEAEERQIEELAPEELTLAEQELSTLEKVEEMADKETPEETDESENLDNIQEERSSDVEGKHQTEKSAEDESAEMSAADMDAHDKEMKKELNKEARQIMKGTMHEKEGLIVHRPKYQINSDEARAIRAQVFPVVDSLSRQVLELLDSEESTSYQKGKYEGQRFNASRIAYGDLRNFDKKIRHMNNRL